MASIVLTMMGCIDFLAYGTIFMCAMFCSVVAAKKIMIFSLQKSLR
jgi:hypothetical protein